MRAAVLLGLDVTRMHRRSMIGLGVKPSVTYVDVVTIDLGNEVLFQTEVSFTEGLDAIGMGLLGQKGLFDHFDVSFQLRRGVFTIGKRVCYRGFVGAAYNELWQASCRGRGAPGIGRVVRTVRRRP